MGRERIDLHGYAADACELIGLQVRLARIEQGLSQKELARRVGVSAVTVAAIEHGSAAVSIGNVFNCCAYLHVPLFTGDPAELARRTVAARRADCLIPQRVRPRKELDNDF